MARLIAMNILFFLALFFYFENNVNGKDECPPVPLIYCFVKGPELCKNDSDCSGGKICCTDECAGRQCMDPAKNGKCAKKHEIYDKCGTACPSTCENPDPEMCTGQCVAGCFCESGYYRRSDGECVLKKDC